MDLQGADAASQVCAWPHGSFTRTWQQVLRTNPYEVVKAGSSGIIAGHTGRRITVRDVLVAQNCDLRRAGDFFAGRCTRPDGIAAQQLRF